MAYNKASLVKQALAAIEDKTLVFADEVISYLPCSKPVYYKYKLNEVDSIKEALEKNKVDLKGGLRHKMYQSDNATAWIAFYKLLGTEEEVEKLNGSKQKLEHSGETTQRILVEFTDDGLE